jgi:hypothetical protein
MRSSGSVFRDDETSVSRLEPFRAAGKSSDRIGSARGATTLDAGVASRVERFRELEPPVTMAEIRDRRDQLLALRRSMQDQAVGPPIYFPWIPYSCGYVDGQAVDHGATWSGDD